MLMYVFMLHHNRALLHLVMCGLLCWFVSFTVLISWKFLIRNMCIMLSDELRAVRNEGSCEGSCGLMYLCCTDLALCCRGVLLHLRL